MCGSSNEVAYNTDLKQYRCRTCFRKGRKTNYKKNDSLIEEYIRKKKKESKTKKNTPDPDVILN